MIKNEDLATFYFETKHFVRSAGYEDEWIWQNSLDFRNFTETDFLRESAWVILCSGFKEMVVRKIFNYISLCFCDWESAEEIVNAKEACKETAISRINHSKKINAIIDLAQKIYNEGFENLKNRIVRNPLEELIKLPYIGEVTVFHLAKNLGFNIAKPDRHLVRMAESFGFSNVQSFIKKIADLSNDPLSLVDLILWRFSTLSRAQLTSS